MKGGGAAVFWQICAKQNHFTLICVPIYANKVKWFCLFPDSISTTSYLSYPQGLASGGWQFD
jgi:hypothetical protein